MTPDSVSKLSFIQFGIDLPPNIGNGGTMSFAKIASNPLLPSSQQLAGAPAITLQPATPTIRVASQTTSEGLAASIPSTANGLWYGTYRITNTVAFAQNAVMTFTPVVNSSPSTKTRTTVAAYVNGSISGGVAFTVLGSTTVQSANRVLNIAPYPSITLNQPAGTCPTAGNANVTDPICFGGLGSADITLSPVPVPVSGSYSVDGGTAASYTTNPFTVSGLSQGSHTVTVTNDPNCAPFDVVFTVGGPSSNPTNTTTQSACDSYTWSVTGMSYTQTGTYTGTSVNSQGCTVDEILDLTITPSTSNTTVASACDSYTWSVNSTNYTQSGTYTSVNGCHTEILDLTITPSTTNTTVASGCDSYTWSVTGGTYTQSGTYSNVGLTITISDDYWMDEVSWVLKNSSNAVIASGGPYPFGGSGGTAVHTVSPSASDYPVTFEIEAFGTFNDNEPNYTVFCNATGSTLLSGTLVGTANGGPGSFTSGTLSCPAATGCVTEILDLTITPSTSNTTVASACDSYTWSVNNMMYTQSGTYTEVSSTNPCHTEILELTITPTTTNTTVASACDSYTWSVNGMMYTMSGTYSEVSTTNPCHTEILDLTITPTTTNTTVASGCDSYTWTVNGMMYTMSGTYSEVSPNNPCHTEILDLTITPSTSNTTVASACDSYTWSVNGMMYTMSGTYSEVSTTNPCHTEILDLTITPTTTNTTVASACDSYTWSVNGMMYTMSGTYSEVSPNNPCHTEILDLTITPSTSNTTVASACDSYTWSVDNMMYTMSGTYTSVNGCHTEILDLTITPSTSNTTVASACDSYTWSVNGMMYTMSGTYSQASTTNPCHTEILDLTITPSTTNTTVASGCDSYTWSVNGMMYTHERNIF